MQAADQDYEREKLNERIAKLSGGVAVIQVSNLFLIGTSWISRVNCIFSEMIFPSKFEGWSTN